METLGKIFASVVFIILGTLIGGFVLAQLWAWFIAPTFGLPYLHIAQAIGLSLTITYILPKKSTQEADDAMEAVAKGFAMTIISAAFALFLGWIVTFFLP